MSKYSNIEEKILKDWNKNKIFEKSLEYSKENPKFIFYDGPPFATGKPHHGHIVASTIKDIIPRYKTQTGYHVPRIWGWDTHGLPIEYEIEKKFGIKTKEEILKFGIDNYNEECRKIVLEFSEEWKKTINRLGRWVNMDDAYKTMDKSFMESIWWVFKSLFNKGLIYHGVKVMPYSTGCTTPLSNFEAKSNYQNVSDPSITVKFKLKDEEKDIFLLVWTTTPWTLPSNLLLCINIKIEYVEIDHENHGNLILSKSALKRYKLNNFKILRKFTGEELLNKSYEPLFNYFEKDYDNCFRIVDDGYVSETSGTGIVHIAPAFGEDDYRVCIKEKVISKTKLPPCPLNDNGLFNDNMGEISNKYFKDANKIVIKDLKGRSLLYLNKNENHEYPFCWRSNTPLIYRSVPCWFLNVEKINDDIIENNKKTNWIPQNLRDGRFGLWLKDANDWCLSRSRYWGTPMPLWVSDTMDEVICIGSVEELEEVANLEKGTVKDLHRHHIDKIEIPSKKNPGTFLKRIPDVFDCWFESGSMPYASQNHPFSNGESFEKERFPADFIAEGLDQTRGWFYTLMVLSTALFNKPAFNNVIVNGLVLAEDGQKMSKSKKNFPDPNLILDKYGSDALRLYLISTPVVRADSMKFSEKGIQDIIRSIHIFLDNGLEYFKQTIDFYEKNYKTKFNPLTIKELKDKVTLFDNMMLNYLQHFINFIHNEMNGYRLYNIVNKIKEFIRKFSKWYMNFNKSRFRSTNNENDCLTSLSVLYLCFKTYSIVTAPFAPFYSEFIYQKLFEFSDNICLNYKSVHFEKIPEHVWEYDTVMVECIDIIEKIIELNRKIKADNDINSHKRPVKLVTVYLKNESLITILDRIREQLELECNILSIKWSVQYDSMVESSVKLNFKNCGKRLKSSIKSIKDILSKYNSIDIACLVNNLKLNDFHHIDGVQFSESDFIFEEKLMNNKKNIGFIAPIVMESDLSNDEEIDNIFNCKKLVRFIQDLRRDNNYIPTDDLIVNYYSEDKNMLDFILKNKEFFINTLHVKELNEKQVENFFKYNFGESSINFSLQKV